MGNLGEELSKPLREITLLVDDEWYNAIVNLTAEVYDGETCRWLSNKEVTDETM